MPMQDHSEEVLDLVDEKDNVIGTVSRSKANSDPSVIHREIAIMIFDDKGRILLQRRALTKKIDPGVWTVTAAGHVDAGITPLETAHTELLEELGFDTELKFLNKHIDKQPNETRFFYWYTGIYPKNSEIKIQQEEVMDAKFFSKSELEEFQKQGNRVGALSMKYMDQFWLGC